MRSISLLIKPASSLCNMRCKYCFYADVSNIRDVSSYGIMQEDTLENMVKKAFEYADGIASFAFQGGEPTVAGLDFFKKFIEIQKKYNKKHIRVQNSIQTNGYAINEEWAKFFRDNNFLVGLSMDGTRDIHNSLRVDAENKGTYDKVVKTAQLFDKYKVEYNILCVVNNFTARHPKQVYDNLKKYKFLQFIPCLDDFSGEKDIFSLTSRRYGDFLNVVFDEYYKDFMSGNYVSVRNFDNYIQMIKGRRPESCAMNGFCSCYFVVEGDGSVFPCDFYVLDEWKMGNVNNDEFEDMIKTDTAKRFIDVSIPRDEKCTSCKYFPLCRGGCRRDREPMKDGKMSLNRLCESYMMFFEHSLNKMYDIARRIN